MTILKINIDLKDEVQNCEGFGENLVIFYNTVVNMCSFILTKYWFDITAIVNSFIV